jgi:2-keto-4-pentenoate hydratase/2-oxohepta-3-ene-1,7-dioic acid hydratase in catechol pathway
MAIHIIRFEYQQTIQWGILRGSDILPIPVDATTTGEFITKVPLPELAAMEGKTIASRLVRILAPVTTNQQFICQGANYRQHMIESGMDPDAKKYNMIFTKASSCIVPADSNIVKPLHVRFLDYEIELGLILKRDIDRPVTVTDTNLHDFVAGIVIVNDVSARDIQIPQTQFYKGKSYRTFGPVGPRLCLLDAQDMHYLKKLKLTLRVNGQVRQDDSTANLVFGPAETLTELSGFQNLMAGDLIATGTPSGCALSVPSPAKQRIAGLLPEKKKWEFFMRVQEKRSQYLKPADIVESRIRSDDGVIDLGTQMNLVVEAV